jgi:hypothetical protein
VSSLARPSVGALPPEPRSSHGEQQSQYLSGCLLHSVLPGGLRTLASESENLIQDYVHRNGWRRLGLERPFRLGAEFAVSILQWRSLADPHEAARPPNIERGD